MVYVVPAKESDIHFLSTPYVVNPINVGVDEVNDQENNFKSIIRNLINLSAIGTMLIIYSAVGAWVFKVLEEDDDKNRTKNLRQTVEVARLGFTTAVSKLNSSSCYCKNESQDVNVNTFNSEKFNELLYKYEKILNTIMDGTLEPYINKFENPKGRWNYFHSLLFVFTLVTTIGYGNLTPKTIPGRVFCIMFALLGIPLALVVIAISGKFLAGIFLAIFGKIMRWKIPMPDKPTRIQKLCATTLSVIGVLNLLIFYNTIGAFLYNYTEAWGFINSFYFCFTTLTTVGFGDLIPKSGVASGNPFAAVRVLYVLFGLALTSTAFELVRKQYSNSWSTIPNSKTPMRAKTPALFLAVQELKKQIQEEDKENS